MCGTQKYIWSPKPFFAAGGFDADSAAEEVSHGTNVAVVFSRNFISNVNPTLHHLCKLRQARDNQGQIIQISLTSRADK